jgi:ribosomal protein L11 methyltransferase
LDNGFKGAVLFSVFVACDPVEEDLLIAQAWEAGTTGIVEEPGGFRAFFEDGSSVPLNGEIREEPETDWAQATRDSFPPLLIGERFYLVPPWDQSEVTGRIRLVINPGMSCGTGWHPCTQLCLEALEKCVQPGDRVVDIGSGSGILSAAARLLGAGSVIGCDTDPEVSPQFIGSADAVKTGSADILVANISAAAAAELAQDFKRIAKLLILSGFTESEIPEGFRIQERLQKGDWVCLIATTGE